MKDPREAKFLLFSFRRLATGGVYNYGGEGRLAKRCWILPRESAVSLRESRGLNVHVLLSKIASAEGVVWRSPQCPR